MLPALVELRNQPRTQPNRITQSQQEDLRRGTCSGHSWEDTGKALLADQSRVILFTLMKSSAKANSFHVAARGNFPSAHDLAEPNTYTTPRSGRRRKNIINQNHQSESSINDQRTIYRSPRHRINDHPHERSVKRVVAMEPRATHRANRRHGTANDPSSESSPPSCKLTATAILASHQAAAGLVSTNRLRGLHREQ